MLPQKILPRGRDGGARMIICGISGEKTGRPKCLTGGGCVTWAHPCVTFWPENALELAQCDTVLAQNDGRIAVMAKKLGSAGA
jgi:hypothetical protein